MISKVVTRHTLRDPEAHIRDRDYWLSRPSRERLAAVEFLRRQVHGDSERLRELLALFNAGRVEYLLVGGYALAHHGAPRFTGDLDLLVHATPENAQCIIDALDSFGFGSLDLTIEDFCAPDQVVQLGRPPVRIDLLTSIDGVTWDEAVREAEVGELLDQPVRVIGRAAFIANKRASGRACDLADLEALGEP